MHTYSFQRASQKMDATGGWEAETIANQVYAQLGVLDLQDKMVENLSGGARGLVTA
jgi:ATPase subunit of ABC transporter with duplicated ATPase domains